MTSFLVKIVMNPIALWLSALLFGGLYFDNWGQIFLLGLVLAAAGTVLEFMFLKRGTLWMSTFLDWAAITLLVWIITPMFRNAGVTFTAALLTGLVFTFAEYFLHRFLIFAGMTRKRERT